MNKNKNPTGIEKTLHESCWKRLTNKEKESIAYLQSLGHRVILKNNIELNAKHQINMLTTVKSIALFKLRFMKKYDKPKLNSPRGRDYYYDH